MAGPVEAVATRDGDPPAKGGISDRARERARLLTISTAALVAIFAPLYLSTLDFSARMVRDGTSLVVGRDFLNFWIYGRAAWEPDPARYYSLATYWHFVDQLVGASYPGQQWSYPPTMMLLAAPFGRLQYLPALALWTVLGVAVLVPALALWTRDRRLLLPMLLCPAALFGLISGQFANLAAAAVLTVLRWRHSRPVVAGVLLGLLTMKPQLGIFFPLLLVAERNWRVIAIAAVTALALAGLTTLLWGTAVWQAYLGIGIQDQSLVLSDPLHLAGPFMPTVFMNARSAGASVPVAGILQAAAALVAVTVIWAVFRRRPDATDLTSTTIFLAAAQFGSPYLMAYDLLPLSVMAALLMIRTEQRLLPLLVFLLPLIQMAAGNVGIPGAAAIPILLVWSLLRRGSRDYRSRVKQAVSST